MDKFARPAADLAGIKDTAEQFGFCIVKGLFDKEKMAAIEGHMAEASGNGAVPDLLSIPTIRPVLLDARLMKIAEANSLKFNDLLSHAMIFYTTGEAMRSMVPSHVPYAETAGIWKGRMGAFKQALDNHWRSYLEGKTTLDAALLALQQ